MKSIILTVSILLMIAITFILIIALFTTLIQSKDHDDIQSQFDPCFRGQCLDGFTCNSNLRCAPYPCTDNGTCPNGYQCNNRNECQKQVRPKDYQRSCVDGGCPLAYRCNFTTLRCESIANALMPCINGECSRGYNCDDQMLCRPPAQSMPCIAPGGQCQPGYTCAHDDNICIKTAQDCINGTCPLNYTCNSDQLCIHTPPKVVACDGETQCKDDELCRNDICVPNTCTNDEECGDGDRECIDGTCEQSQVTEIDEDTKSDKETMTCDIGECPPERICQDNLCIIPRLPSMDDQSLDDTLVIDDNYYMYALIIMIVIIFMWTRQKRRHRLCHHH